MSIVSKTQLTLKFKEINKPFYSFSDLHLLLGLSKLAANKRIIDLCKSGFLTKIEKNIFIPSYMDPDYEKIANYLFQPAYLSFESALAKHGVIEESEVITLATPIISRQRQIRTKKIIWSKLSLDLFWGFEKSDGIMIAKAEKAFADLLYLLSFGRLQIDIDSFNLDKINMETLREYIERYPTQTTDFAIKLLKL